MNVLSLRLQENSQEAVLACAGTFLKHLFSGSVEAARRSTAEGFSWFGQAPVDWNSPKLLAFLNEQPTTVGDLRLVKQTILEKIPRDTLHEAIGELGSTDHVVLADLNRRAQVTSLLVIRREAEDHKVQRIQDAWPLRAALECGDSPPEP